MEEAQDPPPESLLPYDVWTEDALRQVIVSALAHAAAEGLPGDHHFYITFRTDHPGVVIPPRLRAQYPEEMTIVLQHQFWDLKADPGTGMFSVGLSFGGIPSTLSIPLAAVTGFADPQARIGLRFRTNGASEAGTEPPRLAAVPTPDKGEDADPSQPPAEPQVVSLDAFRRRAPGKE